MRSRGGMLNQAPLSFAVCSTVTLAWYIMESLGGGYEDLEVGIGKIALYLSVPKEVREDVRAGKYGSIFLEGFRSEL